MKIIHITISLPLMLCATSAMAQPGAPPSCPASSSGQDDSSLCVQFILKDGQLLADPGASVFTASKIFSSGLKIPAKSVAASLTADLNAVFKKLPRLYWFGLTDDERTQDSKGTLKSAPTDALRHFTGSWADFRKLEPDWKKENLQRLLDAQLLGQYLNAAQGQGMIWGALFYPPDPGPPLPLNARNGTLTLKVADPINWEDPAHFAIQVDGNTGAGLDAPNVKDLLRPLQGHLWRDPDLREFINQAIQRRGTAVTIEITDASHSPKQVHLTTAARIARVVFSPPVTDSALSNTTDLDRTLYILLDSASFHKYLGDRKKFIKTGDLQVLDYRDLGEAEPLFNSRTFGGQQADLKQLGFTAGSSSSRGRKPAEGSFVDIVLQKDTTTNAAQPNQGATASAGKPVTPQDTANKQSVVNNGSVQTALHESAGQSSSPLPPRDKKNYIGAGFEYKPGQGVTPIVDYERLRLLGPGFFKIETGSNNDKPLVNGNLNFDYIAFSSLHRRVAFSSGANTQLTVNRLIGNRRLDERRNGVTARLEAEALRNFHGALLLLYTEGRRVSVDLSNTQGSVGKQNLTMVDFGESLTWAVPGAAYPWSFRLDSKVRRGLGVAASEPVFTSFSSTANFHWVSLGPLELDLSGQFAWAGHTTPLVELPSFGGVSSVRGFRADDLLATQLWGVQPEVWLPVPGTQFSVSGVGAFLRRSFRIAVFSDFGHVSHPVAGPAGYKGGPGAGIRFLQGPVVLQLDWAKAVGDAVTYAKWGRVYFNMRFN